MSVAPRPKTVDDFISAAQPQVQQVESIVDIQPVKLRLPKELLEEIDQTRSKRKPRPSRHQYILEALYEKIIRENG
jgi:hypothetical protein